MREEIMTNDLEAVAGGKVYLSGNKMKMSFTALEETYSLNCSYEEAKRLLTDLFVDNDTLSDYDFDCLVKDEFSSRGWI